MYPNSKIISELRKKINAELSHIYPESECNAILGLILENDCGLTMNQIRLSEKPISLSSSSISFQEILKRLKKSEPIQYILGWTFFFDRRFNCKTGVLIPRSETEELVDWALKGIKKGDKLLDIGCGSGCISISLALERPDSDVVACDISEDALGLTEENATLLGADIGIISLDILKAKNNHFKNLDLIISNPPYITVHQKGHMHENVINYEPEIALFVPDNSPLLFYEQIAKMSLNWLKPGGSLYFELNESYADSTKTMLLEKGYLNVTLKKDINGKLRMLKASKP